MSKFNLGYRVSVSSAAYEAVIEMLERRAYLASAPMDDCGCGGSVPAPVTPTVKVLRTNSAPAGAGSFKSITSIPSTNRATAYIKPDVYTPFNIDAASLTASLATAPMEGTAAARNNPLILSLPTPNGSFERFQVFEWQIMEAPLAAQFPQIKAYRGQGVDDPAATAAIDFTVEGFHAQVISPKGAWFIDPYYHLLKGSPYISYFKRDLRMTGTFTESVPAGGIIDDNEEPGGDGIAGTSGNILRNYRYGVGATGEYVAFHGGTVPLGLSAVTTSANRISGVYEVDFACRLTLVANQNLMIYTNAATDPFTSPSNPSTSNTQNQTNMDAVIGNANYDVGHVYYRGSDNGLAGAIGNVCITGQKAKGYSSHSSPINDPFNIDYVAHELGHQFGGRHNFNNCNGSQGDSSALAVEVGSGNTIMSYAGICGSTNLQAHSDAYFNSINHDQITSYTQFGSGNAVPDQTATGNNIPTVDAGPNYTIPANTPFTLTATGSDADGGDVLTYAWEQRNGGGVVAVNVDNGVGPFMRPWSPVTDPTRTVPRLANLVNNTFAFGEIMPTTTRSISMFVQVRDNRAGGGGSNTDFMTLNSVNTGAGFSVTAPNTAVSWNGASTQNVTWNVSGTTANGINTANVAILLSTDGGFTYPTVILASTANDGSESITVPNVQTSNARIKVAAVGNIFFDISNVNFTINQQVVVGTWTGNGDGINWTDPNNWSNNIIPGPSDDATINVGPNPSIIVNGAQSVRSVNSAENLTINGSITVSQSSTFGANVTVNSGGSLNGAGAMQFTGTLNMAGGSLLGAGLATVNGGASMNVTSAGTTRIDRPFTLNGNGSMSSGGNKLLLFTNTFALGGSATLDMTDNDMAVDYSGGTPLPQIQAAINSARNGGAWNGFGLTSASALANGNTTLGAMEASDYPGGPNFDGEPVNGTMVLVKYTWYGDSDFNGKVDGSDYARMDSTFNQETSTHTDIGGWFNGDADGNGKVDGADYALIDAAFNAQTGILRPGSGSFIPPPAGKSSHGGAAVR